MLSTYISALGAIAAIIAAIFNIWFTYRCTCIAQASKVSVWSEDGQLRILNGSDTPVYAMVITACVLKEASTPTDVEKAFSLSQSGEHGLPTKKGGGTITSKDNRVAINDVPPGLFHSAPPKAESRKASNRLYEVTFNDDHGRCWVRSVDGKLKRKYFKSSRELFEREDVPKAIEILREH